MIETICNKNTEWYDHENDDDHLSTEKSKFWSLSPDTPHGGVSKTIFILMQKLNRGLRL